VTRSRRGEHRLEQCRPGCRRSAAPDVAAGAQVVDELQGLGSRLSDQADAVREAVDPPPDTASELATSVTAVADALVSMRSAVEHTAEQLQALDEGKQIEQALHEAAACQGLTSPSGSAGS
jgi:methyl-accepting chemotaxis protein